jgi:hypothetical protein
MGLGGRHRAGARCRHHHRHQHFIDKLVSSDLSPTTISITWRNLRPFFSWWAKEADAKNPFDGADTPTAKTTSPCL